MYTDTAGDPHSPRLKGFWSVQLGNVFYYARDITLDRWDRWFFHHGFVGPVIGTLALCGTRIFDGWQNEQGSMTTP